MDFLENLRRNEAIINICNRLLTEHSTQHEIDTVYEHLVNELHKEMDDIFNIPWWNAHLKILWAMQKESERKYLKCKGNRERKRELLPKF
jgi:hypothetical protein